MDAELKRQSRTGSVSLFSTTTLATTLRFDDFAGGVIQVGTMSTNATTLQMWAASASDGTFARLYMATGVPADITLSPSTSERRTYALPDEVFGVQFLKILSSSTNSTSVVGTVTLKS